MNITSLAVDFGNTNTVIAIEINHAEIRILEIPSISIQNSLLNLDDSHDVLSSVPTEVFNQEPVKIGKQAYRFVDSLRTASAYESFGSNFKHELINSLRLGKDYRPDYHIAFSNSRTFIEHLCWHVKKELAYSFRFEGVIPEVIATVPVSSPLEYINFLRSSLYELLPCGCVKILDEATCAAQYFDSLEQGDTILVVDIGGSTTDLSLVEVNGSTTGQPVSVLLARNGLRLGGLDIDILIANKILEHNELGELDNYSIKTRTRVLRIAETAKKYLTSNSRYLESFYDPDLAMDLSVSLDQSVLKKVINQSYIPSKLTHFFGASRLLIEGAGVDPSCVKYMVFVGGTTLQPVVKQILFKTLKDCSLPVPDYAESLGIEVFSSVALGAIKASKMEMVGNDLLNSICLKIDGIYKPIFRRGQTIPAKSREFAFGKQHADQTHLKFCLAELDNFSDVVEGSSLYRPITCNGEFYRMEVPSDTIQGDYRFITSFFVDDQIRIYSSIKDKYTGLFFHKKIEIGNKVEIGLLSDDEIILPPYSPPALDSLSSSVGRNIQNTSTQILFSRPENPFEQDVQDKIYSWSFNAWLMTGAQIPATPWKPDHILILESGALICIEDKNYSGNWVGLTNGPWRCNGSMIECGTTRGVSDENPMKQVGKYFGDLRRIMNSVGISDPFILTTVVAPDAADISRVDLGGKTHHLVKLDQLYDLVRWVDDKSRSKLGDIGQALPLIDASGLRSLFHLGS